MKVHLAFGLHRVRLDDGDKVSKVINFANTELARFKKIIVFKNNKNSKIITLNSFYLHKPSKNSPQR